MTDMKTKSAKLLQCLALVSVLLLISCGGGGGGGGAHSSVLPNRWTWVSGSNVGNHQGVYGAQGTATAGNIPGTRKSSVSWIDSKGMLWLFGGGGYDSTGSYGDLNDLWKFDGSNWTWVSGSNLGYQKGIYGTLGSAAAGNVPGGRYSATRWVDGSGKLWLFGGYGVDSAWTLGDLNDLWMFDGGKWTWVSGGNVKDQNGAYGTLGIAAPGNIPGGRNSAVSWVDGSGNLWLFGGLGYGSTGSFDKLNDLWKFDGSNWTWVSGSNVINQKGIYGLPGIAAVGNTPGARWGAVSWVDSSGKLWLFGGSGYDASGSWGNLNDLWKFDGSNWTWVSGSNFANQTGVYGTQGAAAASNVPGGRENAVSWIDGGGKLWLFGGYGYDSAGSTGYLNDLWNFDGSNWVWVSGSNIVAQKGVYGTQEAVAASNVPGGRDGAVSWVDGGGKLWLFGGVGYDSTGVVGNILNDLWCYKP